MSIPLDPGSPEPLYRQVRLGLEEAIAQGRFRSGRLPSSRELAAVLGVSRNTVNLAYQELVAEGFVLARPRSGMLVNPDLGVRPAAAPRPSARPAWLRALAGRPPADTLPHLDKPADWHRFRYPFVTGQLPLEVFPATAWVRCLREALTVPHRAASLSDAHGADDPLLVRMLCREVLPARGIRATPAHVLVTNGSQQGCHLLASALVRPGDRVAVEDPGYPDARHILARAGAELVPLPVDRFGVVPDPWPPGLRMAVVTPSHQYPTNVTLSAPRRARLAALAAAHDVVLVEDDYDAELQYVGHASRALTAAFPEGSVHLGSFSKFLAPGLRIGYVVGDPDLIAVLRDLRRYTVRHPSGHQQRALALLIASGGYRRSVRTLRRVLRERWVTARQEVARSLPGWDAGRATGGTSLWLTAPPGGPDTRVLAARAARAGVLVETGETFFLSPGGPNDRLRLGFSAIGVDAIAPGIAELARCAAGLPGRP